MVRVICCSAVLDADRPRTRVVIKTSCRAARVLGQRAAAVLRALGERGPCRGVTTLAAVLLAGAGWVCGPVAAAPVQRATVLSIGDGDTLRVRQGGRAITVRLACIDAPEVAQSPWGQAARRSLQHRLPIGREVSLVVHTTDRYGRTVAEVIAAVNVNLVLVADGQAFAYRRYLGGCDAKAYLDAEDRASRRRYGVWQVDGGITRPWDFRRGR